MSASIPGRGLIYFGPGSSSFGTTLDSAHVEPCAPRRVAYDLPPYTRRCLVRDMELAELESLQRDSCQYSSYMGGIPSRIIPGETPPYLVHYALPPPFHAIALDFMSSRSILRMVSPGHRRAWIDSSVGGFISDYVRTEPNINGRYPPFETDTRRDAPQNSTATEHTEFTLPARPSETHQDSRNDSRQEYPHLKPAYPYWTTGQPSMNLQTPRVLLRSRSIVPSVESHIPRHRAVFTWIENRTGIICGSILLIMAVAAGVGFIIALAYLFSKLCDDLLHLRPT